MGERNGWGGSVREGGGVNEGAHHVVGRPVHLGVHALLLFNGHLRPPMGGYVRYSTCRLETGNFDSCTKHTINHL